MECIKEACTFLARRCGYGVRMKFFLPTILVLLAASAPLRANLGETETQIRKRYGKIQSAPVSETNRDITEYFLHKNYVVGVKLLDGSSQRESYTKKNKESFTDKELEALLEANANGGKWVLMNDGKDVKIWILESHTAFAGYYKKKPYVSIETRDLLAFEEQVKQLKEKQRMENH
jgi:hypothetical protein